LSALTFPMAPRRPTPPLRSTRPNLLKSADRLYAERNGAADSTQHHVKAWWGARMRKAPKKRTSKAVKAADRS
jgi:hypothetical protein